MTRIAKGAAQRILIEIASADHIEASCLQSLCDQARIVGRRRRADFFGHRDETAWLAM